MKRKSLASQSMHLWEDYDRRWISRHAGRRLEEVRPSNTRAGSNRGHESQLSPAGRSIHPPLGHLESILSSKKFSGIWLNKVRNNGAGSPLSNVKVFLSAPGNLPVSTVYHLRTYRFGNNSSWPCVIKSWFNNLAASFSDDRHVLES